MTERRAEPRHPTRIEVDYGAAGTFLFAYITDISAIGIFIQAETIHPPGTSLDLRFSPGKNAGQAGEAEPFALRGTVVWTTDGDDSHARGMGIELDDPSEHDRSRLEELVATVAYLDA